MLGSRKENMHRSIRNENDGSGRVHNIDYTFLCYIFSFVSKGTWQEDCQHNISISAFFNSTYSPPLTRYCRGPIRGHRMKFYQQRTAKLSSSSFMCYCLLVGCFFFSNKYFRFRSICESIISIKKLCLNKTYLRFYTKMKLGE